MTRTRKITYLIVVTTLFLGVIAWWLVTAQGLKSSEFLLSEQISIHQDKEGIYDIAAPNWNELMFAQGYVTAGERLFQLDLMRRKASGALAALFGSSALAYDTTHARQNWLAFADQAVDKLTKDERESCEQFAGGINQFINTHTGRWGLEYLILRSEPDSWLCRDSLLVMMLMIDDMTNQQREERNASLWQKKLPTSWWSWIFLSQDPRNHPLFPAKDGAKSVSAPQPPEWIPLTAITPDAATSPVPSEKPRDGSNSWSYRSPAGAWLANDPHLGYQMPQLWFPLRMQSPETGRVVGVSLPGIPGVLIGMNEHIAWSITNTQEDVDDLLIEELNADGTQYVSRKVGEQVQWKPIELSKRTILVKGEDPTTIELRATERGPLIEFDSGKKQGLARQWIGLQKELTALPTRAISLARDWTSFNAALDQLKNVPLNFTMLDRRGNMGLRISGTTFKRRVTGNVIQDAQTGTWQGQEDARTRPRLWIPAKDTQRTTIATANQKLWNDIQAHHWASDERAERIRNFLAQDRDLTRDDMIALQRDTYVDFHKAVLAWIGKRAPQNFDVTQRHDYLTWDGHARKNPELMGDAIVAIQELQGIVLKRLQTHFGVSEPIFRVNHKAWCYNLLISETGLRPLGLSDEDVVQRLLERIQQRRTQKHAPYYAQNATMMQHPFVGRVPVVGSLFKIDSVTQEGFPNAVLAEAPTHGPSGRFIWDPAHPEKSLWGFPIGLSGHVGSPFYKHWQKRWSKGDLLPVF